MLRANFIMQVLDGPGVDPPAALTRLSHLQRCYLENSYQRPAGSTATSPLPAGPWLISLRWLGASIDVLMASAGCCGRWISGRV